MSQITMVTDGAEQVVSDQQMVLFACAPSGILPLFLMTPSRKLPAFKIKAFLKGLFMLLELQLKPVCSEINPRI